MTDEELIKTLRGRNGFGWTEDAADRIEALVNENYRWKMECEEFWRTREDVAEAKLAKAVAALRFTDDGANHGAMTRTYGESALRYILRGIRERARTVLAELEKTE
jgi:hypothetical protein